VDVATASPPVADSIDVKLSEALTVLVELLVFVCQLSKVELSELE
jgi:hypothetical protein